MRFSDTIALAYRIGYADAVAEREAQRLADVDAIADALDGAYSEGYSDGLTDGYASGISVVRPQSESSAQPVPECDWFAYGSVAKPEPCDCYGCAAADNAANCNCFEPCCDIW